MFSILKNIKSFNVSVLTFFMSHDYHHKPVTQIKSFLTVNFCIKLTDSEIIFFSFHTEIILSEIKPYTYAI